MADRRLWRGIDADLFRFATTDLRELHLALMAAFEEAAVLAPALNLDQVRGALADVGWSEPLDDVALGRSLQALVGWGLLEATQDHAAHYSTPEEFERKNLQWSLTRRGEAAVGGVLHALDELRHAVGLQPAVLDAIGDALDELADRLSRSTGTSESARIHILLAEAEGLLTSLVTSVRQFNGHLQRLLREEATDDDVFIDVKRRTISYLEQYVDGVERPQRRLKHAVERLGTMGLESLFDQALTGANLAPVAGGDPAPGWLAERNRRWLALQAWFAPDDDSAPRITGLLDIARTAIIELLRVLERRWDSRRRSASVANDFRALATWFAAAPGDADAHQLFGAAFGLWSSRHAHLAAVDLDGRGTTATWLAAEPVDVAPALRTSGNLTNRGNLRPVSDPAQIRASRQAAQARILAEEDEVRSLLISDGAVRLSNFQRLDARVFGEFLSLVAAALEAPLTSDGTRRATSVDGQVDIVLSQLDDGSTAVLHTENGVLRAPNMSVTITLASDARLVTDAGTPLGQVANA
jgi:uncharacterized protein (TIGR02677 family)